VFLVNPRPLIPRTLEPLNFNRGKFPRTVRSCVLIKPRPKKVFADRFVWAFSHKGLSKICGRFVFFWSASRLSFSGSEDLLTRCPYEADGKNFFFGRGLIRTQERTARVNIQYLIITTPGLQSLAFESGTSTREPLDSEP
jgi:hypothetical protein